MRAKIISIIGNRRLLILIFAILMPLLFGIKANAEDIYISQSAGGGDTGEGCENAHSIDWFRAEENWANPKQLGKIGPGDTVHLCGTISGVLAIRQSGSPGLPITIVWESGAKLSQAAAERFVNCRNNSYLVFDGGENGIIENTANGTGLGQAVTKAFDISLCTNVEIKNLTIQNLYVHTSTSDNCPDVTRGAAVYSGGPCTDISIHDITFNHIGWVISFQFGSSTWASNIKIFNNDFENFDHGIAIGQEDGGYFSNVNIFNNHFGSTVAWDTDSNKWHHDGLHFYCNSGAATSSQTAIYNNLFDGDWGTANATAMIFFESRRTNNHADVFNNVFIAENGSNITNGLLQMRLAPNSRIFNNTIIGSGKTTQTFGACITIGGDDLTVQNNVIAGCATLVHFPNTSFVSGGLDYNIYRDSTSSNTFKWVDTFINSGNFAGWQSSSGEGGNSSYSDTSPVLSSTGKPLSGSPVINVGINLSGAEIAAINSDKDGNPRPEDSAWDIGAYNYENTSQSPPQALNLRIE